MTSAKLTLYDLVVDLIPGLTALLLFAWILQPDLIPELVETYGAAVPAIVLLAAVAHSTEVGHDFAGVYLLLAI